MFYITAGTLAILTYISAKRGLLNTVNTEYHERAMDKLQEISEFLISEFDMSSENYWVKDKDLSEILEEINENFEKNKEEILKTGEYFPGIPINPRYERLSNWIERIKSDPFVPKKVREAIVLHLDKRANTLIKIHLEEIRKYCEDLAKGKYSNDFKINTAIVHNIINNRLYKEDCGISQIQTQVHDVRNFIQIYLESFNPFNKR
jgi:hypothetical protein